MYREHVVDGIHLTVKSGVPKLISIYKIVTNKLLGMKDPRDGNMRKGRFYQSRFNHRSPNLQLIQTRNSAIQQEVKI